jgi:hypothetical protein
MTAARGPASLDEQTAIVSRFREGVVQVTAVFSLPAILSISLSL